MRHNSFKCAAHEFIFPSFFHEPIDFGPICEYNTNHPNVWELCILCFHFESTPIYALTPIRKICSHIVSFFHQLPLIHVHVYPFFFMSLDITEWRRPIGCLIFIDHFPQKSHIVSGSFAKDDLQLSGSLWVFATNSATAPIFWDLVIMYHLNVSFRNDLSLWGGYSQQDRLNYRSRLQKRPIKETIFCKRDL